jgi:hypothetical protein
MNLEITPPEQRAWSTKCRIWRSSCRSSACMHVGMPNDRCDRSDECRRRSQVKSFRSPRRRSGWAASASILL